MSAWQCSRDCVELEFMFALGDSGDRKVRCIWTIVAIHGKLSSIPFFGGGGGLPVIDNCSVRRLLWYSIGVSRSIALKLNVCGRSKCSGKLLLARSQPAQNGEDESGKSDQSSQAAVDDGQVAGIMVDGDWDGS